MANAEFMFNRKNFPNGLQTLVGEKGMKLSGGQKQRLSIARALMKEPKILIFDEATSSLDPDAEAQVQLAIDNLIENHHMTIIMVAHRLAAIQKSKSIFVINDGKLVEQGTHKQLNLKGGIYKSLFEK